MNWISGLSCRGRSAELRKASRELAAVSSGERLLVFASVTDASIWSIRASTEGGTVYLSGIWQLGDIIAVHRPIAILTVRATAPLRPTRAKTQRERE